MQVAYASFAATVGPILGVSVLIEWYNILVPKEVLTVMPITAAFHCMHPYFSLTFCSY